MIKKTPAYIFITVFGLIMIYPLFWLFLPHLAMVMKNICTLLSSFINCFLYKNIIFCWVMYQQSIIDDIIAGIEADKCNVFPISLICQKIL